MGTNYYGHSLEHGRVHLCKTSRGWVPAVHHTEHYDDWASFRQFVDEELAYVEDEYGDVQGKRGFLAKIDRWRAGEENRRRPNDRALHHMADGMDFIEGWFQ